MQQSEAACQLQRTDATTTQQEYVPNPSAATDSPQRTENTGNTGSVSGSNNPIIVGSSGVNINYNYPLEGPGVPAPRPQHSQRQDQEPRQRTPDPSYQDVGNKTSDILKRVYKTTGSYVQLLPGVDNDQMHIAGIYTKVQLETREGVAVTGQKGETVNSTEYEKIFRLRTKTGELIKRLVFFGMGGVGKSTIFDKIAFDWADQTSKILNGFKLVFLLKMCALSQKSDLVDSTFDQLLGEKSKIEKGELDEFILANPNEVLILLDGFDEMTTKTLDAASFGFILKALNRIVYQECFICVSTRPSRLETLMSTSLVQNPCTHVEVLGFTDDDVKEYVQKFYEKIDPDSGKELIQTVGKSNTLRDFATNPMLLLLICLLWRESKQLPETTSRLFTKAVNYMFTRKDEDKKRASDVSVTEKSETLNAIGQTALRGLMDANQKFSFQEDEFEPKSLDLALKAGILTQQRVIKNLESHNNIQFTHKTMQEYCAARYLQSIHMSNKGLLKRMLCKVVPSQEFKNTLGQLCQTIEGVVSNEFLVRFCCGDNEKCMTDIVNLLDLKFNKDESRYQSNIVQAICRNCFFESQSARAPRCLTSDSHIPSNITVGNSNEFRSLIYLLEIICRSDSRTEQLARVETIQVFRVTRYPVSDLAVALGYMENLRDLRLKECLSEKGALEKTLPSICSQHFTMLIIEDGNTLGGRAAEWAPHIKHLASLEKLQIKSCELQGTDIKHIALAVGDMPNLTDLILDENQTLSGSADSWNKEMPTPITQHLKRLNLSKCNLTWKDFEYIASAVGDMSNLTDLILYGNRRLGGSAGSAKKLPKMTHLRRLDLGGSNLETTDIEHIASAVGDMPELTDLGLTFNGTLASSALLWAKELPKMKHLNRLDLTYCHLNETDIEHIAVAVRDMPVLTDLNLNSNWVFSDLDGLLSHFPSLRGHVKT
ncbi:NACHT, LRR and PYD domains-containing protein 14-like [Patiria miniata]|uniref:NACHT domain-containing protein n=1 Tax=Patiria miniata TaxID=46514 RepID=A0A913Z535_PATMI|nr:NACHT, LRR and PYD domains-containing protein 14-like [Patiria miniata]